jgi:glycine cleavage system H protein
VNPSDLSYTTEHEWVRPLEGGAVQFGITDFAQDALGDIVFVDLPEPGTRIIAGEPCGEVESTKSVSDVYAPVTGEVSRRNDALLDSPETINADPYGQGWLVEVRADAESVTTLTAAEYEAHIAAL